MLKLYFTFVGILESKEEWTFLEIGRSFLDFENFNLPCPRRFFSVLPISSIPFAFSFLFSIVWSAGVGLISYHVVPYAFPYVPLCSVTN